MTWEEEMDWLDSLRVKPRRPSKVGLVELKTWGQEETEIVVRGRLGSLEMSRDYVDVTLWRDPMPKYILGPSVTTATIISIPGGIWPDDRPVRPVPPHHPET